jgi:hypothetical protein
MKYVLMILCASLFSVLAAAADANQGVDASHETPTTSGGAGTSPSAAPGCCLCDGTCQPTLAMAGKGVTNNNEMHPSGAPVQMPSTKGTTEVK